MSYSYRKIKRLRCHNILHILYSQFHERLERNELNRFFVPLFSIIKVNSHLENQEYQGSITELLKNGHIQFDEKLENISVTANGIEAYKESFYVVENRKDYLEETEKYSKWIFPVISLMIAIIALTISLINFVLGYRKG